MILLDDHLTRDFAARRLQATFDITQDEISTTNLWLFRLVNALAREVTGALTRPIDDLDELRHQLTERLEVLTVVPMEQIVWSMADLRERHRASGRPMSTAMVEALAAAHCLDAEIAVSAVDVGPTLQASAEADGIAFRVVEP